MSRATAYYTSYSRALHKYATNGFFARDLDADDFAFIEQIRERGYVACGSLALPAPTPCTNSDDVIHRVALLEEMQFWAQPYPVDKIVVRRSGPIARPQRASGVTPHAIQLRENRELIARARADEEQRLKDRQIEQLRRDVEWVKAAPKPAFGRVDGRHYVPQWKIDDAAEGREMRARSRAKRVRDETAETKRQLRARKIREEAEHTLQSVDATLARTELQRAQKAHEEVVANRKAVDAALAGSHVALQQNQRRQNVKAQIMTIMRAAFPRVVTLDALMTATRCTDQEFLISCADELIREGALGQHAEAS
jgi:hypothetical protein